MHSKVSSEWLSSYIKATRPVLEIFKMALYFPDRLRNYGMGWNVTKRLLLFTLKQTTKAQRERRAIAVLFL